MNILLIDDEHIIQQEIGCFLKKSGYKVFNAYNGKEALNIFAQKNIDLTIADIMLPDIDGIELLNKFKSIDPKADIIMITGHGNIETARKAARYGALYYLLKPIDLNELLSCIKNTDFSVKN